MKPTTNQSTQPISYPTLLSTGYEWQKRSNSHNVISEYNIFMTPAVRTTT